MLWAIQPLPSVRANWCCCLRRCLIQTLFFPSAVIFVSPSLGGLVCSTCSICCCWFWLAQFAGSSWLLPRPLQPLWTYLPSSLCLNRRLVVGLLLACCWLVVGRISEVPCFQSCRISKVLCFQSSKFPRAVI